MNDSKLATLYAGMLLLLLPFLSLEATAQSRMWGTYFGGAGVEVSGKIAVDGGGNTYITGKTRSTTDVATPDAFDGVMDNELENESSAYLAKFDAHGALVWATYYGTGTEVEGHDVGLDALGNVYLLGTVDCPSKGVISADAHDIYCQGYSEMFLAKFDSKGNRIWGTYFGGTGTERSGGLSVTPAGSVYLIGSSNSPHLMHPASVDATLAGESDAVIAKFSSFGKLVWARYYGGNSVEVGWDIDCKATPPNNAETCYVTGDTTSTSDLATQGAYDTSFGGEVDSFVARISGNDGKTVWSTYYGGSATDRGLSVAVTRSLVVYLGGNTYSSTVMATPGAFDDSYNGGIDKSDMFLAVFSPAGIRQAATYYGNAGDENLFDIALDAKNNLFVFGDARADGNITTPDSYDESFNGYSDAVLIKFSPKLARQWGTFYGGKANDAGGGIALGANNHLYIHGMTDSKSAIATQESHQSVNHGADAFLVEFSH